MKQQIDLRKRLGLEIFRKIHQNRIKLHELKTLFWECSCAVMWLADTVEAIVAFLRLFQTCRLPIFCASSMKSLRM